MNRIARTRDLICQARRLLERQGAKEPVYSVDDGHDKWEATLTDMRADNPEDPFGDIGEIAKLRVGETYTIGGGAAGEFEVRRIR